MPTSTVNIYDMVLKLMNKFNPSMQVIGLTILCQCATMVAVSIAEDNYTVISNSSSFEGKDYFTNHLKCHLIYTRLIYSLRDIS
jgi:hypothetical protein